MPQTQIKASEMTAANSDQIKSAGMSVAGVKWVNINADTLVITHDDEFDSNAFVEAVKGAGADVTG